MGKSPIEWCDFTMDPWIGCSKVATGCKFCYAEISTPVRRGMGSWGPHGRRHVTSQGYWNEPLRWNRAAEKAQAEHPDLWGSDPMQPARPQRPRVFCASLADVFEDRPDLLEHRARLILLIQDTPALDWLLLTKRPEDVVRLWREACEYIADCADIDRKEIPEKLPRNVWMGASASTHEETIAAVEALAKIPASLRFLSLEPLVDRIRMREVLSHAIQQDRERLALPDWIIVGGESGQKARPCNVEWIREIVKACHETATPCFVKQLGSKARWPASAGGWFDVTQDLGKRHPKGGDPEEWPQDLRVRQFPERSDT